MGMSECQNVLVWCRRSNLVITMIPSGLKKPVNVSLSGLWILKKTPDFCWNGAFETYFWSAGKVLRCILYVEELWLLLLLWWSGNFNFCSNSLFFRATPGYKDRLILVWMSCFWNSAEFQDLNPEWNQEDLKSLLLFLVPRPSCCWLLFLPLLKLHDLEEEDKLSPPKVCLFPPHIKFTLWPSALCICAPKSALCRGR